MSPIATRLRPRWPRTPGSRATAPMGARLTALQCLRVVSVLAMLGIGLLTGRDGSTLLAVCVAQLVLVAGLEVLALRAPSRVVPATAWAVVADGTCLAVAAAATGGFSSPALSVVLLAVVAQAQLLSYGTGVRLAAWTVVLLTSAHLLDGRVARLVGEPPVAGASEVAVTGAVAIILAAVTGAALHAVTEGPLRRGRAQVEQLVRFGREVTGAGTPDDAAACLAAHARDGLGFARAAVLRVDGEAWAGVLTAGRCLVRVEVATTVGRPTSPAAPALLRAVEDPVLDAVLPGAQDVVVMGLRAGDEVVGVLAAEWARGVGHRIPAATVQALEHAASHAALAIRNATLLDRVRELAIRDPLTGLANRRLFDESLARELERSRRLRSPLSVLLADLDRFKEVNDAYGHPVGDELLREVAASFVGATKGFDLVARLGGDEFAILLPGCRAEDALAVAERLRRRVRDEVTVTAITASLGAATFPDDAGDAEGLVRAADHALYDAKRSGRDRAQRSVDVAVA